MATKSVVTGDRYMSLDGKLFEIKRQLRQEGGYPHDLDRLERVLQDVVEGRFDRVSDGAGKTVSAPCEEVGPDSGAHVLDLDDGSPHPGFQNVRSTLQVPSRASGRQVFHPGRIGLYEYRVLLGHGESVLKMIDGPKVLPASAADYLLAFPELIPEAWKGKDIYFFGTLFCQYYSDIVVRYIRGESAAGSVKWYLHQRGFRYGSAVSCAAAVLIG